MRNRAANWPSTLALLCLLPPGATAQPEWRELVLRAQELEKAGNYEAGALQLEQALDLAKSSGKATQPLAVTYNNLGSVYDSMGRILEAERAFKHSIQLWEKLAGPDCVELTRPLNNLAGLYRRERQWSKARKLYGRSMEIRSRIHHPADPGMAVLYNNVAQLELDAGNFAEADRLMVQALTIWDREPEQYAAERAAVFNNRAFLMIRMDRYAEAGPLAVRAITIGEKALGIDHPSLVSALVALAAVDRERGAFENAEAGLQRALAICGARLDPNHPYVAIVLSSFADLRKSEGQHAEAKRFERESKRVATTYRQENKLGYVVDVADILSFQEK